MVPLACVPVPGVGGGGWGGATVGNKVENVGGDLIMNSPKNKPKKHGYFILLNVEKLSILWDVMLQLAHVPT